PMAIAYHILRPGAATDVPRLEHACAAAQRMPRRAVHGRTRVGAGHRTPTPPAAPPAGLPDHPSPGVTVGSVGVWAAVLVMRGCPAASAIASSSAYSWCLGG